jgi:hypothetical protein
MFPFDFTLHYVTGPSAAVPDEAVTVGAPALQVRRSPAAGQLSPTVAVPGARPRPGAGPRRHHHDILSVRVGEAN